MYSEIHTYALQGIRAVPVKAEIDISTGLPMITMVGSLGSEVREAKDRVWAALRNVGLRVPSGHITVNLSPADLHKDGAAYDLAIAAGLLECMEYFPPEQTAGRIFLGELGLNGEIKSVRGVLPIVRQAALDGFRECIVPEANVKEASIVPGIGVRGASDITKVLRFLESEEEDLLPRARTVSFEELRSTETMNEPDFDQVRGQAEAKRAALISAAGFHSLLMTGPPGAGKSMIAKRIPGILPELSPEESLEVSSIYSIAGRLSDKESLILHRKLQSPHHSISRSALIGGGQTPRPGAITLSHRSVLFLDELPEFSRDNIDALRQPLEEHRIHIDRAKYSTDYPADFLLVCAMNPCPCGFYPDRNRCRCTEPMLSRYLGKISGPILDRIDLCVELKAASLSEITSREKEPGSAEMRALVTKARAFQEKRFRGTPWRFNAEIPSEKLEEYCPLDPKEAAYMEEIYNKLRLSARSYHRTLRVARTIADLEGSPDINCLHLTEAVSYRPDHGYWRT